MKRTCSIFLIIALLSGLLVNVSAAGNALTAEYRYDGLQDALIVNGTVTAQKGNVPLTMEITGPDGQFLLGQQTTAKANNFETTLDYTFDPVYFGINFNSGAYTLEISGYEIVQPVTLTFVYSGVDLLFAAMQEVNAAIESGSANTVFNAIQDNADALGVSQADMLALGTEGKTVFSGLMAAQKCSIPADIDTDANREMVKDAALVFRKAFAEGIAVGKYNDIQTTQDLKNWLDAYRDEYALNTDDTATQEDEAALYPYVEKILTEAAFAGRIAKRTGLTTITAVKSALYADALLTIIEKNHYSETKEIIDQFPALFPVNRTRFKQLSSTKQGQVYERVAGKSYSDYAAVTTAFDQAVSDLLGSGSGSGGSGGAGNGGSSGGTSGSWGTEGSSGVGIITTPPENPQQPENTVFNDLSAAAWAEEAILYLADQNIVAGKAEGAFLPNDPVTRAEFTKMIVTAVGAQPVSGDTGFADVTSEDWFAPYVNTARQAGLVMGDEENRFNPNAQITRQDMAVILYRAYQIQETGQSLDFVDQAEISDYAKDAVSYFYSAGIISGVGDGRFAPRENATRAQAAVMLYNVMTKLS